MPQPEFSSHPWREYRRLMHATIAPPWRSWLTDPGSLTERLVRVSGGDFRVRVLRQGWQIPQASEARRLGIRNRHLAIVREVELICRGKAVVYARSVIPQQALTGNLRRLKNWDSRSLGSFLFSQPDLKRTCFEIAQWYDKQYHIPVRGRRSVFQVNNKPVLVSEIFLCLPR